MAYWWVNQGQTYEEEFRGSYLWAPKRTKDGNVKRGYLWPISSGFAHNVLERMDPAGSLETDDAKSSAISQPPLTGPLTIELEEGRALTFEQVLTPARREAVRAEWQLVDAFVRDRGRGRLRRRYPLGATTVNRWRRYGKDRLYVNDGAGETLGYADLETNEVVPTEERHRLLVGEAVAAYLRDA